MNQPTPHHAPHHTLSVVVPVFNEAEVLHAFHERLIAVLASLGELEWEILYVNDGSRDTTLLQLHQLHQQDPRVTIIDLSRNFGKEIALTAGLDHAMGDGVVIIDADLQDPPELIPEMVDAWREGIDVAYATRRSRDSDSLLKRATAFLFYRLIKRLSRVEIPEDTGDFRLLSRRAVDAVCSLRERHRFMKGLFSWVGFSTKAIHYQRDARHAGKSKWHFWSLFNFAIEGITSFSTAPLRLATYMGLFTAGGAFLFALFIIYKTLVYGDPVAGYPSLMVVILFLGGVQLLSLGIIGEYIGRMFNETKGRPLYLVNQVIKTEQPLADFEET